MLRHICCKYLENKKETKPKIELYVNDSMGFFLKNNWTYKSTVLEGNHSFHVWIYDMSMSPVGW